MRPGQFFNRSWLVPVCVAAGLISAPAQASTVAQVPLFLGEGNVPGSLVLTPSVEFPTVLSFANIRDFDENSESVGYFDSGKCYRYQYDVNESERHFYPVKTTSDMKCPGDFWSGNYLNWAATQTIDPFRWALTGGYRVKDTLTETWVEKARHSGQHNNGDRKIEGISVVNNATPFSTTPLITKIGGLPPGKRNQVYFTLPSGHGYSNITTAVSKIVLADTDFGFGWNNYSSGAVERTSAKSYESGGFSLKKINNDDPHGGYKEIGSTVDFDSFVFEGWIQRSSDDVQAGQSDRIALSDSNANGYGFSISGSKIKIEKRTAGSPAAISITSTSWTRPNNEWYRFVFESQPGNKFKLTVYNDSGIQLATVTSKDAETDFSNFTRIYIHGGHEYYVDKLTLSSVLPGGTAAYEAISTNQFSAVVRVKVCDANIGVEDHCKQYGANWKPEGLIQRYSDEIRYSVFGYLNDSDHRRDGGVLRASQKYVGPTRLDPTAGVQVNPNMEWDPVTGILVRNPDSADAADTASYYGVPVNDSGVINYLNKFGQLNDINLKGIDPVSELYYTALRYLKNQSNIEEYYTRSPAHASGADTSLKTQWVDGFPVIRNWSDPIQYSCQKNVVLGIGDVNTHRDKNLPGNTNGTDEPSKPSEVSNDGTIDVRTATDKIAQLEGITINTGAESYTGRKNSAFMAGLAYDANTKDIRPSDLAGTQTVQTFWVDVLENKTLEPKHRNQFWLTAKYGGFVPRKHPSCKDPAYIPTGNECADDQSLGDPYSRTAPLPEWWWYTNTDILDPKSGSDYKRADNFYTAGEARKMVDGLTSAFASIAASVRGAASALTANTSRLGTGSALFNALMDTTFWSGDLVARGISSTGVLSSANTWSAATIMDALSESSLSSRKVFTSTYANENSTTGITLNSSGVEFKWTSFSAEQKEMLKKTPAGGPLTTDVVAQQRLDFLRGSRTLEQTETNTANLFRRRGSRLGDIVNSSPQYVNKKNYGFSSLGAPAFSSTVGGAYKAYRTSTKYQAKPPILLVGANDGMLHAFDARTDSNGGKELFAFVPSGVFGNLFELAYPEYSHRYYVDGVPRVSDAWFAPADVPSGITPGWKTVAAVTLGAGGSGVSLLDISDPANMTKEDILWEFAHKDMGALIQQPFITPLQNGKFGVVVTSGFSHGAAQGHIWILNVANGAIIKDITIPTSGGLGQPAVVDLNRDRIADRIIVGDTLGNVWRFDINNASPNFWNAPTNLLQGGTTPVPFYVAKDASGSRQPITGPINTAFDSQGRHMALFGTGSYHLAGDNQVGSTPQVQTLYGIRDTGFVIADRLQLLKQEVLFEGDIKDSGGNVINRIRVTSDNNLQASNKGWYLDLAWLSARGGPGGIGELINTRPVLRIGQLLIATKIPSSDPCKAGGTSWILALDYENGGRLKNSPFDYNEDGNYTDADLADVPKTDANGNPIFESTIGSGISFGDGFTNIGDGSFVKEAPADAAPSSIRACLSNSSSETISCPEFNGTFSQGRKGWREIR